MPGLDAARSARGVDAACCLRRQSTADGAGYAYAAEVADFIECDVVLTKDRGLFCRHEPLLSDTTDADEKFPERATTYTIDGVDYTGVFSVDLTSAEMKTLRAVQPNELRDPKWDGQFEARPCRQWPHASPRLESPEAILTPSSAVPR